MKCGIEITILALAACSVYGGAPTDEVTPKTADSSVEQDTGRQAQPIKQHRQMMRSQEESQAVPVVVVDGRPGFPSISAMQPAVLGSLLSTQQAPANAAPPPAAPPANPAAPAAASPPANPVAPAAASPPANPVPAAQAAASPAAAPAAAQSATASEADKKDSKADDDEELPSADVVPMPSSPHENPAAVKIVSAKDPAKAHPEETQDNQTKATDAKPEELPTKEDVPVAHPNSAPAETPKPVNVVPAVADAKASTSASVASANASQAPLSAPQAIAKAAVGGGVNSTNVVTVNGTKVTVNAITTREAIISMSVGLFVTLFFLGIVLFILHAGMREAPDQDEKVPRPTLSYRQRAQQTPGAASSASCQ